MLRRKHKALSTPSTSLVFHSSLSLSLHSHLPPYNTLLLRLSTYHPPPQQLPTQTSSLIPNSRLQHPPHIWTAGWWVSVAWIVLGGWVGEFVEYDLWGVADVVTGCWHDVYWLNLNVDGSDRADAKRMDVWYKSGGFCYYLMADVGWWMLSNLIL